MDKLFVQFMGRIEEAKLLSNGFSHVYKECKNAGDFYWVDFKKDGVEEAALPITKGTIYVSTFFPSHVFQAFLWAESYPDLKVVVGGPAVKYHLRGYPSPPKNVIIKSGLAEKEIFNKERENKDWGIEVPEGIGEKICVSFVINRQCYWKKCLYCGERYKGRKGEYNFDNSVAYLKLPENSRKRWRVWLSTPCIRRNFLVNELPKLRRDIVYNYTAFMRADKAVINALKVSLKQCSEEIGDKSLPFTFFVGVEFPSERMLKIIQKGITSDNVLKLAELLTFYKCDFHFSFILGWNILTRTDVKEVRKFAEKLKRIAREKLVVHINPLVYGPLAPFKTRAMIVNKSKIGVVVGYELGPYKYLTRIPILSKEQRELNREVRDIYVENFEPWTSKRRQSILEAMLGDE